MQRFTLKFGEKYPICIQQNLFPTLTCADFIHLWPPEPMETFEKLLEMEIPSFEIKVG